MPAGSKKNYFITVRKNFSTLAILILQINDKACIHAVLQLFFYH